MPIDVTQQPLAAACWAENRIDIIGIGPDLQLYHNSWNGSSWEPAWGSLGGSFSNAAPAIIAWAPDSLGTFGIDDDTNEAVYKAWDGSTWDSSWVPFDGGTFQRPVVVDAWGPDRLDIFGIDATNDAMIHQSVMTRSGRAINTSRLTLRSGQVQLGKMIGTVLVESSPPPQR